MPKQLEDQLLAGLPGDCVERRKFPNATMLVTSTKTIYESWTTYFGCSLTSSGMALIASSVTGGQCFEVLGSWCAIQNLAGNEHTGLIRETTDLRQQDRDVTVGPQPDHIIYEVRFNTPHMREFEQTHL